ncbi:MAG: hypothetical protein WA820_21540 [Bradyrhizobium sp.]|jgi:hypothetical protein
MRAAFIFLLLLIVAGCSSQQAFDTSRVKMSVDGAEAYKSAKIGVGQPF